MSDNDDQAQRFQRRSIPGNDEEELEKLNQHIRSASTLCQMLWKEGIYAVNKTTYHIGRNDKLVAALKTFATCLLRTGKDVVAVGMFQDRLEAASEVRLEAGDDNLEDSQVGYSGPYAQNLDPASAADQLGQSETAEITLQFPETSYGIVEESKVAKTVPQVVQVSSETADETKNQWIQDAVTARGDDMLDFLYDKCWKNKSL
ncbi:MAG: hypothetical protein Q9204_005004 [Flavoplaca sp. TL-2023a]